MTEYLSNCHNAPVRVVGGTEGTNHYECAKCGKLCNFHEAQALTDLTPNFKQFQNRPANSITISDSNIHIPSDVFKLLESTSAEIIERVDLFYNDQTNELKIFPNPDGTNKIVKARGNYYRISSKISQVLVPGIYVTKEGREFKYLRTTNRRTR